MAVVTQFSVSSFSHNLRSWNWICAHSALAVVMVLRWRGDFLVGRIDSSLVGDCKSTHFLLFFPLDDITGAATVDSSVWRSCSSRAGLRLTERTFAVTPLIDPAKRETEAGFSSWAPSGERKDSVLSATDAAWRKQKLILAVEKKTTICFSFGSSVVGRQGPGCVSVVRLLYRLSVASTHLSWTKSTTRAGWRIFSCRDIDDKYLWNKWEDAMVFVRRSILSPIFCCVKIYARF